MAKRVRGGGWEDKKKGVEGDEEGRVGGGKGRKEKGKDIKYV